jgi:hypothetical protein
MKERRKYLLDAYNTQPVRVPRPLRVLKIRRVSKNEPFYKIKSERVLKTFIFGMIISQRYQLNECVAKGQMHCNSKQFFICLINFN